MLALVAVLGCDTFFRVRGVLTDCSTRRPISTGVVSSRLLRGAGEEPSQDHVTIDGAYDLLMNEPPSASFEFVFSAPGYTSRTVVVDTTPERGATLEVCLDAAAMP